ncbi:TonB-dependent receptor family protein [Chitinophaga nivalis]|uniref:TonB-dependent receptor family protein n=1 Tax=Chitinophaga nivalis TaxID=2991709 RepID=A0ABT3INL1_9BACT|nr:TonB-dependent receptor family protein [Chitinophaga nivalis]MCW3464743.1 TonB-dependent receptor family protein [Chitinophaga nivalis]MCW3485566.1 TonB-dependent receptor family protein [Chitinophaga nivalis]
MKTKKNISILILLLFVIVLHAQEKNGSVTGKVTDSLSNAPMPFATVVLLKDGTEKKNTLTDKDGQFGFAAVPYGTYTIAVKFIGYADYQSTSLTISAEQVNIPPVQLAPAVQQLNSINITARKPFIEQSLGKLTVNVSESPAAAGNTLEEILKRSPGVKVNDDGSVTLNGKKVMMYIDGRPSYLTGEAFKNLLVATSGNNVDKIELISNPASKYDAQAAAVIDIKIKKIKHGGFNGRVSVGGGGGRYGRYTGGLDLNYRNNKLNIYGGYDYLHNQSYLNTQTDREMGASHTNPPHIYDDAYDVRKRDIHNINAGINYDFNASNTMTLELKNTWFIRDIAATSQTTFLNARPGQPDVAFTTTQTGNARFSSPSANLYYRHKFDTLGKEIVFNGSYYHYNQQWQDEFITDYDKKQPVEYLRNNSPQTIMMKSLSADYSQPVKTGKLDAGLKTVFVKTDNNIQWENWKGKDWETDAGKTNYFIYHENVNAGYITYANQFKKVVVQAGLRVENTQVKGTSVTTRQEFTKSYTQLFPSAALQYLISDNHQLGLTYRRSIDRPNYDLVNPFLIFQSKYNVFRGNPDLNPQLVSSVELSHSFKNSLITTLSYARTKDVFTPIYKQGPENTLITTYENLHTYDLAYAGLTYSKDLTKWWTTATSLQGYYVRFNYSNDIPLADSRPGYYINSSNTFLLPGDIKMEISGLYSSRASSGLNDVGAYWSVNAGLQKKILQKKGTLSLNVNDIFKSTKYWNRSEYQHINVYQFMRYDSRYAMLTFSYRFGNQHIKSSESRQTAIEDEKKRVNTGK